MACRILSLAREETVLHARSVQTIKSDQRDPQGPGSRCLWVPVAWLQSRSFRRPARGFTLAVGQMQRAQRGAAVAPGGPKDPPSSGRKLPRGVRGRNRRRQGTSGKPAWFERILVLAREEGSEERRAGGFRRGDFYECRGRGL